MVVVTKYKRTETQGKRIYDESASFSVILSKSTALVQNGFWKIGFKLIMYLKPFILNFLHVSVYKASRTARYHGKPEI